MFKNRVREGRGFTQTGALETQVSLTAAGWPAGDFACVLWEGSQIPSWASNATSGNPIKCGFIGTGSEAIALTSLNGCTIGNIVHGSGGAYTTFDVYGVTGSFGFQVTGTTGGVTNVFAYLPGYNLGQIDDVTQQSAYYPPALTLYSKMACIRWMWMSNVTSNLGQNTSSTRRTISNCQSNQGWWANATQGTVAEGYPVEWYMYFCKYAGCDCWLTLPVWEDGTNDAAGTYSNAVLTLANSILIPAGRKLYLEIGNELWNSTYACGANTNQTLYNRAIANGFSTSGAGAYAQGIWSYLGYKLHALASMCRTVFGGNFGTQVKVVFASQAGGLDSQQYIPWGLSYIQSNYGTPSNDVQCLSAAPYVVPFLGTTNPTSVSAVLSDLATAGQASPYYDSASGNSTEHLAVLARTMGMVPVGYEAGWDLTTEATGNAYAGAAIMNSGMEATMRDDVWKPCLDAGYSLIMSFESGAANTAPATSNYSPNDEWSTSDSGLVSSGSPRYNAIVDINTGGYTPQRNQLTSRGQVLSGNSSWDNTGSSPTGCTDSLGTLFGSACWGYQLYNLAGAGTYSLQLNFTGSASAATILVNGTSVYSGAIAAGNKTISGVSLVAGFNVILIYNGSGITAVNSVTPS